MKKIVLRTLTVIAILAGALFLGYLAFLLRYVV